MASLKNPPKWLRIAALVAITAILIFAGKSSGLFDDLSAEKIRSEVTAAGWWGIIIFVVIFSVGELMHLPGMIFVAAGILAYGQWAGFAISLVAALISVCVSFVLVRVVGGKMLEEIKNPFLRKMLDKLDHSPVKTVFILRCILWLAPPLNYGLAMSRIRFRHYAIGSAMGLVPPVAVFAVFFEYFLSQGWF